MLDDYAKKRVDEILEMLPDDDEKLVRAWVAHETADGYSQGERAEESRFDRKVVAGAFAGLLVGGALAVWSLFIITDGWPLHCGPVQECPDCPEGAEVSWTKPNSEPFRYGHTDDLVCIEWAGTFSCIPKTKAPDALPFGVQ